VDKTPAGLLEVSRNPGYDSDILSLPKELYAVAHTIHSNNAFRCERKQVSPRVEVETASQKCLTTSEGCLTPQDILQLWLLPLKRATIQSLRSSIDIEDDENIS
jgi:hypothetical protein